MVAMDAQTDHAALPLRLARSAPATDRVHVYVLMDALGWAVAEPHGFLRQLLPHRRALRTTLGYSSGAIPTILTGEAPSTHGHWNLLYLDPERSPFRWLERMQPATDRLLDNRYGRFALGWLGRHQLGLGPSFECAVRPSLLPWFNWAERKHLYEPRSIERAPTAFDYWQQAGVRFNIYSHREGKDFDLIRRATAAIEQGRVDTVFVYLCELDHHLHLHRSEPLAIRDALSKYAPALEQLAAAAARRDPQMHFRVFSDHGMAPVHTRLDLAQQLDARGWRMPQDYLAVFDSTMVRCWYFSLAARADIEPWFESLDCGHVLSDTELREHGTWFPDRRFGQTIFLLNPGVMIAQGDFNGKGWNPEGMHGYHPDDPDSDAALLSNHAADMRMQTIGDLFSCLCEALPARRAA